MRTRLVPAAATAALALTLLVGCASESGTATDAAGEPTPTASPAPTPSEESAQEQAQEVEEGAEVSAEPEEPAAGRLVDWETYEADPGAFAGSDVVLYFAAPWCHLCQDTDASLASTGVPAGLTLVKVDYDDRTDLRQRYGVTVQHSFVKVDEAGERTDVWTGTISGADIAARAA